MKREFLLLLTAALTFNSYSQNDYEVKVKEVKEQKIDSRSDFAKQFEFIPITKWAEGMKFIVVPPFSFSPDDDLELTEYKNKNKYGNFLKQKDWKYKIFIFKKLEFKKGEYYTDAIFENDGKLYKYTLNLFNEAILARNNDESVLPTIRKLAFLEDIDKAKISLVGKTLYILSTQWKQQTDKGERIMQTGAKKFVPVTVTQVGLGSVDDPVRVVFKFGDTEAFIDTYLSGINSTSIKEIFGGHFDEIFSFEDPRKSHIDISDEMWAIIQNGSLKMGMTEVELILSWGKPEKTNMTIVNGANMKQLVYGKQYLYFDNGKLSSVQSSN